MGTSTENARNQATVDHSNNTQTPMKTEQQIPSYVERDAYNAQLDHERKKSGY
jgi:hypothetical protein